MGGRCDLGRATGSRERPDPRGGPQPRRGQELARRHRGTLGEIIALRLINEICDAPVTHHPIDFERSVDDVDLVVDLEGGPLRLEAKAHVLAPGKRWFMVNRRAHERSLARNAEGYVPLITALGAPRAQVGSLLTTDELSGWGAPTVSLGDPAIGVRLQALATSHFGRPLRALENTVPSGVVIDEGELAATAARAGADFDAWRRELPDLARLPAKALRDAVTQARARIERVPDH
ncbi:hypothetical protein AB0L40_18480 [Patulibacter sp. NPDC049589]|uniref:hypothetical protein n=1 Tax=Patulibacter sp. NPDC049589 TaxID=3154731 RepID=UPI0034301C66